MSKAFDGRNTDMASEDTVEIIVDAHRASKGEMQRVQTVNSSGVRHEPR